MAIEKTNSGVTAEELMEQAQTYASTWASVGGPFDDGNTLARAEEEKDKFWSLVEQLVQERDDYRTAEEHQIALRKKSVEREQALVADLELLRKAAIRFINATIGEDDVTVESFFKRAIDEVNESGEKLRAVLLKEPDTTALDHRDAAASPAYPPCDYCGDIPASHPWHGSGFLDGKDNPHIHACNECRHRLPSSPVRDLIVQADFVSWLAGECESNGEVGEIFGMTLSSFTGDSRAAPNLRAARAVFVEAKKIAEWKLEQAKGSNAQ